MLDPRPSCDRINVTNVAKPRGGTRTCRDTDKCAQHTWHRTKLHTPKTRDQKMTNTIIKETNSTPWTANKMCPYTKQHTQNKMPKKLLRELTFLSQYWLTLPSYPGSKINHTHKYNMCTRDRQSEEINFWIWKEWDKSKVGERVNRADFFWFNPTMPCRDFQQFSKKLSSTFNWRVPTFVNSADLFLPAAVWQTRQYFSREAENRVKNTTIL